MVVVLGACAGCGRIGFDDHSPANPDGSSDSDGATDAPSARAKVITARGAIGVSDVAYDAAGRLAVVGSYATSLALGPFAAMAATMRSDVFLGVLDATGEPTALWTGGALDFASGEGVVWLPDGSLAVTGFFSGMFPPSMLDAGGRQAALVARFDRDGAFVVARGYGNGIGNIQARGIDVNADAIAIGGIYTGSVDFGGGSLPFTTNDNAFVALLPLGAEAVASRGVTASGDVYVNDVAFGPSGGLCVVGRITATADFGGGPVAVSGSQAFVARYDAALALQWVRLLGASAVGRSVDVAANDDCVAGGAVVGMLDLDGQSYTSAGQGDAWIGRLRANDGTLQWLVGVGGTEDDSVTALAVAPDGDVVALGFFSGTVAVPGGGNLVSGGGTDALVVGLDAAGAVRWQRQLGGTGDVDTGQGGLALSPDGGVVALPVTYRGELEVPGIPGIAAIGPATGDGAVVLLPIP